jgi:hypothetical protein
MSGTPTEAEIQAQWRAAIDVVENIRNFADATLAGGGGKFDVLEQLLEGDYLPAEYANLNTALRSGLSAMLAPGVASQVVTPALFEYAQLLKNDATAGFGSGFRTPADMFRALYEWMVTKALTVKSRAITYNAASLVGTGNGVMSRLTVDENNFAMEACTVEKKQFRCRSDQNNGVSKWAEVFEFIGSAASFDNLLRASFGSGESAHTTITSKHAGSSSGGSLLTNSSFSEFNASSNPRFTAWQESGAGAAAGISQDVTAGHQYRSFPGEQTSASLKMTGGGGTMTLTQNLSDMTVSRLDPNTPYFLRVMVNKTIGTAVGGNLVIRMGSRSTTIAIASLAANWTEVIIAIDQNLWFRRFNQDALTVQIEWNTSTSGYLLVDDAIFCPWDLIDGTYWLIRQNANAPVAFLVDDVFTVADSGGAPATGKVQWYNWVSGYGYLPSSGSPTFVDP